MEKLAKIQKELKAPKDMRNSFGGYNYRSAESILEAVKPLLDGAILTLSDNIELIGTGDNARWYVHATATFEDGTFSKTTHAFAREPITKKGMDDSQITGTASSYARKYALNGLFCIDDNKDAGTGEYQKQTNVQEQKSSVDDIINGIQSKMTAANAKAFYARAIEQYPKGSDEYKAWVAAWIAKKDELEADNTRSDHTNNGNKIIRYGDSRI